MWSKVVKHLLTWVFDLPMNGDPQAAISLNQGNSRLSLAGHDQIFILKKNCVSLTYLSGRGALL